MDTKMRLLGTARQASERREADGRMASAFGRSTCRRWVLGIIPVADPCPAG